MKKVFIGLFGMVFGAILVIPSYLIGKTFSGHEVVGSNPAILAIQVTGSFIFVAVPIIFWLILPLAERYHRKKTGL